MLTFLSGMILTLTTWPAVSKICLRRSSPTFGSKPPTYRARLLGSGAARRTEPPADDGGIMPVALFEKGDGTAIGIGLLFCGMTTGGSGGGGMCEGLDEPFVEEAEGSCRPGAAAVCGSGPSVEAVSSAMVFR